MKDQYVGDINDYWKYALLRALRRNQSGRLHVCWMLTPPDDRMDGGRLAYLASPSPQVLVDPELFDVLRTLVAQRRRSVRDLEATGILGPARFHREVLNDDTESRQRYFEALWRGLSESDAVFFDPDNGLEVGSARKGRRNSSKYLYWDEVACALELGCSVCVYQHFPRVQRVPFICGLLDRMATLHNDYVAFAIASSSVAYLCCVPAGQAEASSAAAFHVVDRSHGHLRLQFGRT